MTPLILLRSRWVHYGLLALLCAGLWVRGSHYADKAEQCANGRKADRAAYVAAQREAEARAIAAKQATEARSRAEAERTDDDLQKLRVAARAASERYRLRNQAAGSATRGTAAPADDNGPASPDRSRPDAVMVSQRDFDILVDNTLRLKAAHDWAKTLNQPLPDPAFGHPSPTRDEPRNGAP